MEHKKMEEPIQEFEIPAGKPIEVVALAVKTLGIRCRVISTEQPITFRKVRDEVEGEILTIIPSKVWRHRETYYMTGEIKSKRIDVPKINLEPLSLNNMDIWDPEEEYWGEPNEPINKYFKPIIDFGVRDSYEMDQVIPFQDPEDFDSDPIIEAADSYKYGNYKEALKIMEKLLTADLRCLDAHAHLGNWDFNRTNEPCKMTIDRARRHYEVGFRIGELSLGSNFNGVLPWACIDNRPFLRCMHGYGLSLWRLGQSEEAREVFERMLWLNPSDNQGIRFLLADIDEGKTWYESTDVLN